MRQRLKINKKLLLLILVAILISVPVYQARAQFGFMQGLDFAVDLGALSFIGWILSFMRGLIVSLLWALGGGINLVLSYTVLRPTVVKDMWEIVRNFANMFFVIILILMAFSTMFGVTKTDFRTLIGRFIVAVLLINFSFVIGEIIIDWSQSLSNVFLTSIGNPGDRLGQGMDFGTRFARESTYAIASHTNIAAWDGTLNLGLSIILLSILLFAMGVMFFVTIVRIPILWILLIVSPIAWMMYILPSTRKINQDWWKYFLGWNLFLPIYLFFIYFAVYVLDKKPSFGVSSQDFAGITFNDIFFYVITAIFLIGGAKFAMSASMSAGAGGVAAGIWARGRSAAWATARMPYQLGKYGVGVGWRATGAEGVYKEAKERFKREGFAGFEATEKNLGRLYKGERGREEMAARLGQATGLAPGLAQKQFEKNTQYAEEKFKRERYTEERLKNALDTGAPEEKLAAANMLKSQFNYDLNTDQITELFDAQGGAGSANAVAWLRRQGIEDRSREDLEKLEGSITDPELRRKIARIKAKRGFIPLDDQPDASGNIDKMRTFKRYLSLFPKDFDRAGMITDSKDLIDGLKKDEVIDLLEALEKTPGDTRESRKKLLDQIKDKGFLSEDKLRQLTDRTSGLYESDSERERLLDSAKRTNLLEALTIKKELGLLKDLYTREKIENATDDDVDKVMKQEFAVNITSIEDLAKIKSGTDKTTGKKFGFADVDDSDPANVKPGRVLKAFQESLNENRRAADKVKNMYMDQKLTNNAPLLGFLDSALQEARQTAFMKDKGTPFIENLKEVTDVLIPEISSAKDAKDDNTMEQALERAKGRLKQASSQLTSISEIDYVKKETKQEFADLLADANVKFNRISAEAKTKGPNKET